MNHVMLDIETMGKTSHAAIISIGACYFDPATGEIGDKFYQKVDLESAVTGGGVMDTSTVMWWLQQSDEARAELVTDDPKHINIVLYEFSTFLAASTHIWGNGSSFDNVIVENAYRNASLTVPWAYNSAMDVRTVVELGRAVGIDPKRDLPFDGERHNALADAIHQARYVSLIWQRLTQEK